MKKLLLATAAVALLATSASAANIQLPTELRGEWCRFEEGLYYRDADCDPVKKLTLKTDGSYDAWEVTCKIIESRATRRKYVVDPVFVLKHRCFGLDKETWIDRVNIFLGKGGALVADDR
jgi:hypothetical protein